jgi:hypothetical protein
MEAFHRGPCTAVSGRRPCHACDMLFDLGTRDCRLARSSGVRDFSVTGHSGSVRTSRQNQTRVKRPKSCGLATWDSGLTRTEPEQKSPYLPHLSRIVPSSAASSAIYEEATCGVRTTEIYGRGKRKDALDRETQRLLSSSPLERR